LITPDHKGVIYVPKEEMVKLKPKRVVKSAPLTKDEPDLIDRKRELKRWKQSFSYYCLHPEKFRFGIRDFK
jgi:hypothetical protein